MPILYYHINAASKNPFKIGLSTLVICNIQFLFEFLQYNASTEFTSAELSQKSFKTGFYCHIKNWNTILFGIVFIRQYSFLRRKSLSQRQNNKNFFVWNRALRLFKYKKKKKLRTDMNTSCIVNSTTHLNAIKGIRDMIAVESGGAVRI